MLLAAGLALAMTIQKPDPVASPPMDLAPLKAELDALAEAFPGKLGYSLRILPDGPEIGFLDRERFPSASTIKTVVMLEVVKQVEEGKLNWTDKIAMPPVERRSFSQWSYLFPEGKEVNLDGLVHLMMSVSDNTTTVMLANHVGGGNVIEQRMLDLGLRNTKWTSNPPADNPLLIRLREQFRNMGVTTPGEMTQLLAMLDAGELASPAATDRMIRIMRQQYWDDFIAIMVPRDVVVAGKVGALNRSRSEIAIVYGGVRYALAIYTDDQEDQRWISENPGNAAIREISSRVWNALHPDRPYTPPADSEKWYPTGAGI